MKGLGLSTIREEVPLVSSEGDATMWTTHSGGGVDQNFGLKYQGVSIVKYIEAEITYFYMTSRRPKTISGTKKKNSF